ncbi:hypothetical protein [Streptococcus sp. X13SY08]|uniref:hypothetical protein n=1 Tax=Streptococcus sp. X13SY08 TaxID=1676616 RepID=UPI000AC532CD|nr:hypothetical protein [Streptococcus sp. X13SY08]
MTFELLLVFLAGLFLVILAYIFRQHRAAKISLAILGSLLMIAPLALIVYFIFVIFST